MSRNSGGPHTTNSKRPLMRVRSRVPSRRRSVALVLSTGALLAAAIVPASSQAATWRVNSHGDPAPDVCNAAHCSLREAILAANDRPGPDRILLEKHKGEHRLKLAGDDDTAAAGDLDIYGPLLIRPANIAKKAKINGRSIDRIFETFSGHLQIQNLFLKGGKALPTEDGGALYTRTKTTIRSSKLSNNEVPEFGGAIYTESGSELKIIDSKLLRNRAGDDSGAIEINSDKFIAKRSVFTRNRTQGQGGVAYISSPDARFINSRLHNNDSEHRGGALFLNDGSLLLKKTEVSANEAPNDGGGIMSFGALEVDRSSIHDNSTDSAGGGIYMLDPTLGIRPLADRGSDRRGEPVALRIVNSTIAYNTATDDGGGLHLKWVEGSILSSTIARNRADADEAGPGTGGGIYSDGALMEIRNTIFGRNLMGPTLNDCAGSALDSQGHNLISTLGPAGACSGFGGSDITNRNPRFDRFRFQGGPTATFAIKRSSPARNAADAASSPNKDQRGVKRRNPDIGAFEYVKP